MKKPQKKQIIFALIIVFVVGVSATAAILFSQYQALIKPVENQKEAEATLPQPILKKETDNASKRAFEGDVAGGAAELDKAIENTNDANEKYIIYSHKATLLYNSGDLPGGLAAALKAYEFKKSSDSAAVVGQFSRESGNKPQAIEYYKKAIELIDKTDPYWDEDTEYYKSVIKEIETGVTNG
jgi:tetratricopeptide (TPR) repeat protein